MSGEKQVEVIYEYTPTADDQLTLTIGQKLKDVDENKPGDGWWTGTMVDGSKTGTFPGNYVKRLYEIKYAVRAVRDYTAQGETEISFKTNDVFMIIDKDEHGVWWKAKKGDVEGWFPGFPYVKEVDLGINAKAPPPPPRGHRPDHLPEAGGGAAAPAMPPRSTPATPGAAPSVPPNKPAPIPSNSTPPAATPPAATPPTATPPAATPPAKPLSSSTTTSAPPAESPKPEGAQWATRSGMKPMKEEPAPAKGIVRGWVTVQVLEARDLLAADTNGKSDPFVTLSVKKITEPIDDHKPTFKTAIIKKTLNPVWDEQFKLVVEDPEASELVVRVFDHDTLGSNDFLGAIEPHISLRSVDRSIDNITDKWFPLRGKKAKGEIHLVLKFDEKSSISKPKDFQHLSHIGLNAQGVFDYQNLPKEWLDLFKNAGIKKSELSNPDTAKLIIGVINDFSGAKTPGAEASSGPEPSAGPPPPPPVSGPPPPGSGGPPPPGGAGTPPPVLPKPPANKPPGGAPPAGPSGVFAELTSGNVTLRKAQASDAGVTADKAESLEKALANTIKLRRELMNEDKEDNSEDEAVDDEWT